MPNNPLRLIRNGALEIDVWRLFEPDAATAPVPPDEENWMVRLETWRDHYDQLINT